MAQFREMTTAQKEAVIAVTEQLVNMLSNDVLDDNGVESFEGWCEDGAVFYDDDKLSFTVCLECEALMKKVAPMVDDLVYKYLNLGY